MSEWSLPYYEVNTTPSPENPPESRESLLNLARLLALSGEVAWEEGRQSEAVDLYLNAVWLGRRMPVGTGLSGQLAGLACETIGRSHLWRRIPTMNAATASRCLVRLNDMEAWRVPLWISLEEEKYTLLHIAMDTMDHPERVHICTLGDGEAEDSNNSAIVAYSHVVPNKFVADTLAAYMDKLVLQARVPYNERRSEAIRPREPYTAILSPDISSSQCRYATVQAGDALLRTALALRVFQARTGKRAANLSVLVAAGLLPAVPDDPFASPGTSLRYEPIADGATLLYSVGPDGIDDGGKGIELSEGGVSPSRTVDSASKGDLVAGWYAY